ncbi:MAG: nucleotidyltransferase domain-containing protein [bacterium]
MTIKPLIHPASETNPSWYTPITEKMLQNMTRRIVEAFEPEKIILFGSYAYGQPQFHSDIDLLVVTNCYRRKSVFARDRLVATAARPPGVAMDVIVRTPAEVAYRLKIGDLFFREVMTKGQVLYERSQARGRMGAKS